MNGYLMQEQNFIRGEDCFVESFSPENRYGVVFEDDGETGYFYAVEKDTDGHGLRVLDALHIYEVYGEDELAEDAPDASGPETADPGSRAGEEPAASSTLMMIWSRDWLRCALVIDGFCHAVFDFKAQGGYNINEFPPPNEVWTKGSRTLTDELVRSFF